LEQYDFEAECRRVDERSRLNATIVHLLRLQLEPRNEALSRSVVAPNSGISSRSIERLDIALPHAAFCMEHCWYGELLDMGALELIHILERKKVAE
jgi:hypothetical protein